MSAIDWIILLGTLAFIVIFGIWKTRGSHNLKGYLKGDNEAKWWAIGISVMATQASAITFLSTPGQAYTDGMRFVQFYFALPIAMIILSVTFIPIFYRLKVYTAYEFLENRFDLKTRSLAAILFLVQRGLAAGITIYAPSIILSTLLGWKLIYTNLFMGILVILYTVSGGTKAVTQTQKQQMAVMMGGMLLAGIMVIELLPEHLSFADTLEVAGKMGRLNIVNFNFDLSDRYNFWSGMTAALFLFVSYFGTDQSQVQRYISGRSITQSRLGLIMNGLLKVPMQFVILFIGVMVFVFYQFNQPPTFFNKTAREAIYQSEASAEMQELDVRYSDIFAEKRKALDALISATHEEDLNAQRQYQQEVLSLQAEGETVRDEVKSLVKRVTPEAETNDKDYIFMTFVMDYLPKGLVGLLFAVMFSAAMSSTASELNALATTSTIDIYRRSLHKNATDRHYLSASRWFTLLWGVLAISFATWASLFENLIQAVNYLGSIFYGSILGIFLVAFYIRYIKGHAVFFAAITAQTLVIVIDYLNRSGTSPKWLTMGYLWYNMVGCAMVIVFGLIFQRLLKNYSTPKQAEASAD